MSIGIRWICGAVVAVGLVAQTAPAALMPSHLTMDASAYVNLGSGVYEDTPTPVDVNNPSGSYSHQASCDASLFGFTEVTLNASFASNQFTLSSIESGLLGMGSGVQGTGKTEVTFQLTTPTTLHVAYDWNGAVNQSVVLRENDANGNGLWSSTQNPWTTDLSLPAGTYYVSYLNTFNFDNSISGDGSLTVTALVPEPATLSLLALPLLLLRRR